MKHFKFIFLSIMGLTAYLVPFTFNGETATFISHFTTLILSLEKVIFNISIYDIILIFVILTTITAILSFFPFKFKKQILNEIFLTTKAQATLRIVGSLFYVLVFYNESINFAGPLYLLIVNENTGQVVLGLLQTLYVTFFIGILLLPLLTSFGAVEFFGVLLTPVMKKVFRVPGAAAIDALSSFVGDGTIGITVTDRQYQSGYYSQKEAALIASTFSIVGISFATVVAYELGFADIFYIFYGSIFLTTVLIAIILARVPYKKFKNTYYTGEKIDLELSHSDEKLLAVAYHKATEKSESASIIEPFIHALVHILKVYLGFIPLIMVIGTIGLIIAEFTPIFNIISLPLIPILMLIGMSLETATAVAPALVVGFADMYLPIILVLDQSSAVKFFVGIIAFSQLIFLSETGIIMLKSKIGFNFWDIAILFITRTLLAIPIVALITYLLMYFNII